MTPEKLARTHEPLLKQTLQREFSLSPEHLSIVAKEGSCYFSEKASDTLCVLVVDEKGGGLYLVRARVKDEKLEDLKSIMIA